MKQNPDPNAVPSSLAQFPHPSSAETRWIPLRRVGLAFIALLSLLSSMGCKHAPMNVPKTSVQTPASEGYYFGTRVPESVDASDTLFLVAFSGGGTRAAAMSYGVLEELRRTLVPGSVPQRRLIEDINIISSVSGGSFTAAAYALFGDEFFGPFETNFLKRDVQGKLVGQAFSPWNWPELSSPYFGRSDMAAEYYDRILFKGATFKDLSHGKRPFVLLNSTEISTGIQFWFTQDVFDALCSDLSSYPISRAVAASSAVPVLLSPITLQSFSGECGYTQPNWMQTNAPTGNGFALLRRNQELAALSDRTNRPYLHLVDGGVVDNLGLRPLLEGLAYLELVPESRQGLDLKAIRRVVLLSVNARSSPENNWGRHESPPGMLTLAVAAPSITMDRYSQDTVSMMSAMVQILEKRAQASGDGHVRFFPIVLSFDSLTDPKEREYFFNVPTSFFLSNESVDRLRDVGGRLLRESPYFQALLADFAAAANTKPSP